MVVLLADAQQLTVNFLQLLRYGFKLRVSSGVIGTLLSAPYALKLIDDFLQDIRQLFNLYRGTATSATAFDNQIYSRIIKA